MNKLVSVIIPVYNADKYIEDTLQSIIQQTYKNIEIIVVNDGSTDRTSKILENIVYDNMKVINQENKGVSVSRNVGMENSKGEYVIFVDADDILESNMIKRLVEEIEVNNVDIVICGYKKIFNDGKIVNEKIEKEERIFSKKEAIKEFFLGKYFGISLWDKLLKRNIAEKIKFEPDRKINEDKFYLFNAIINSENIYVYNEGLYNYMQREDSVSKSKFDIKYLDIIYFSQMIKKRIHDEYIELYEYAIDNYINDIIYVCRNIIRNYSKKDEMYKNYKKYREELKKYVMNKFIKHKKMYSELELILICYFTDLYRVSLKIFDKYFRKEE